MGIEPMRSENSSFLDCRLNHSAKVSVTGSNFFPPLLRKTRCPSALSLTYRNANLFSHYAVNKMKILSLNLHFFSDPRIIQEISIQRDVDVYCFQEVLWGAQEKQVAQPKSFKCTLRYKNIIVETDIDFASQASVHRDVCRAFGFPKNFEFQLKDENNFVFYPSKKQMQPRAH